MLVQADVSKIELVVAAWLSQDKTMISELVNGIDIHGENQKLFNFPERRIAKIFIFRILYGGTEWAFVKDSDFNYINNTIAYWANKIYQFYDKYSGISHWHNKMIMDVRHTAQWVSPFGRIFTFRPTPNDWGRYEWPVRDIKNYPVQGTAADLVMIGRYTAYKRLIELSDVHFVSTVHDSLVVDCKKYRVPEVAKILNEEIENIAGNFEKVYGSKMDPLRLTAEVKAGPTLGQLEKIEC
jgi:DNA polymerase I-like protein with 3'-5' exonuclease and polymerase domains